MDPFNIKASLKALAASKRQEPSSYQPPQEEADPIQKLGSRIQKDIVKEAPPGLLERAGGTALSGLATVGNLLDVPGSMVRDVATWLPGGPAPANPFDQIVSPFTHHNRTTGRDLMRGYGLAGKEDTMGNFTTGLGAEIALDPLTYLTFGASALTRGGRAAKALNLMDDAPEIASRLMNRRVGKREARHVVTPRMLLSNPKLTAEARQRLQQRMTEMGVTEKDLDRQLGGLAKINMPFSNKPFTWNKKPITFGGLTDEEGIIGAGRVRGRGPEPLSPLPDMDIPPPGDIGPAGGGAIGGGGPDIPPTRGPAPDITDMPDSPVTPEVPPVAGPAAGAPAIDPTPVVPSATINAISDIQQIDPNNFGVQASIPESKSRARATLTYASESDETPMLFIDQFEKQPGSPKGSGRALINSMVEKVKDRNPMGVAGNFDTHDQLGAFASIFGKDKIRFLDRATGQPVDISFAEVNKTPDTISKYTAVHYFIEPPKAAAKVEPEVPQYKPEEIEASRQLGYEIEDIPRSYNEMAADIKSNPVRLLAAESAVGNMIDMVSKEGTPLIQALDQLEWNVDLEFDRLGFGKPSPAEIEYARRGLSIIDRPLNINDLIEYGKARVADAGKGKAQAEAERIFKKYGSFDMDEGAYYRAVLGEVPKPKKQKALIDVAKEETPAATPEVPSKVEVVDDAKSSNPPRAAANFYDSLFNGRNAPLSKELRAEWDKLTDQAKAKLAQMTEEERIAEFNRIMGRDGGAKTSLPEHEVLMRTDPALYQKWKNGEVEELSRYTNNPEHDGIYFRWTDAGLEHPWPSLVKGDEKVWDQFRHVPQNVAPDKSWDSVASFKKSGEDTGKPARTYKNLGDGIHESSDQRVVISKITGNKWDVAIDGRSIEEYPSLSVAKKQAEKLINNPPPATIFDDAPSIPPSALQPDLMTPEVVKEAKKRGRKPKNVPEGQKVTEAEDKAKSAQFIAEQNQQRMLEQKKQEQQGRINNWKRAYQSQPKEYLAASDLGRKDYEKALTAISPMRLMEMVDDGVVRGAFTAQEAADLKLPIASAARADVLKKFVDSIDPSKTPAQAERIAIESYSSLTDEEKGLFGGSRDFGVQVSRYAGEARRNRVPASATQPDLVTPQVVQEAKKSGRKPKPVAKAEAPVSTPAPTKPMTSMEAMQAEAGIKPTTPPNEIAVKTRALLQEVESKRGASDAEVAEMLLRGDTASAIRRLEAKPLDGLKIDGLMSAAKKNGILTDEQSDAVLAAIPPKYKGGMSVLDEAKQVSDDLASKNKLESRIDQTETPEFKNWFKASKAVDEAGKPLELYHGSLADFKEFRPADTSSYYGRGVYLTASPEDASKYASNDVSVNLDYGPKAEKLAGELGISYKEAKEAMEGTGGNVYKVYANLQNPLILDAKPIKFDEAALRLALAESDVAVKDVAKLVKELNAATTAKAQHDILAKHRATQSLGAYASLKNHDGLIVGGDMAPRSGGAKHVVAFRPEQIKSATGNTGEFNTASRNILESRINQTETPEFKNWFGDWKKDPANASKVVDPEGKPLVVYHGTRYSDLGVDAAKKRNRITRERMAFEKEFLEKHEPKLDELRKAGDATRKELEVAAKELAEKLSPDKYSLDRIASSLAYSDHRTDLYVQLERAWDKGEDLRRHTPVPASVKRLADDAWSSTEPLRQKLRDIENQRSSIPKRSRQPIDRLEQEIPFFDTLRYGENDEGYLSAGSYFTADKELAGRYAGSSEGSGVIPVYLNLKNPYIHGVTVDNEVDNLANKIYDSKSQSLRNAGADVDEYSRARATSQREALIERGYDGEIRDSKLAGKSSSFADTEYVAFYPEQIKSATGNRGTFDPNSKNILEAQGGAPGAVGIAPTKVDLNTLEGLPEQARPIVGDMINKIGQRLFDDVTMEIGGDAAKAVTTGDIDMDTGFIRIYNSAIQSGIVDKTTVHELWHHLSKYITPEEVRVVQKEFDDVVKANKGPLPYELSSIDEYFAHKLTDLSMKYLGKEKPASLIGKAWAKALDVFEYLWDAIRQTLGYDKTKQILNSFLDGHRAGAVKLTDATMQQRLVGDVEINGNILDTQQRITDTPAFQKWFGESKVVDDTGKPMIVYHSTPAEPFTTFFTGQHFGTARSANDRLSMRGKKGHIYPVYLKIENPIRLTDPEAVDEASLLNAIINGRVPGADIGIARKHGAYKAAQAAGYDGVVYSNRVEDAGKDSYVVFEPQQIKSATANRGTFDLNNKNILESQADPVIPNSDIAGQLAQAKSAILGKSLDDIGESILDSAVGRQLTAMFDQSVLGQITKAGIEAARLAFKGYRDAVFQERAYMVRHLRTWYDLPNIREDIIMDEELAPLAEYITNAGGDRALGAKNRMIEARKIQNDRVNGLRRLLEQPLWDEQGNWIQDAYRVEESELPAWVGQEKANGQIINNPTRRQQVAEMLTAWRLKAVQMLGGERNEGILLSLVNGYFPRLVSNLPGSNRSLWNPNYGKILDPTHPSAKRRKDWFVGYDDGTSVINDISIDAELSGAHSKKMVREQPSPAEIQQYANVLWERYKDRLMGGRAQLTYGELAQADPKAFAKINKLTEEVMNLDPRHVEHQIPLFSNDLFSAMELRLEHHHRSVMHAKAIQHLVKKNAVARNLIGGDGQGVTLNQLLKESKYDSNVSRDILEVGTRGDTALAADKSFWNQEIQPRINEVMRHYQAERAYYLRNPGAELGTPTGVAPYTDPGGRAFQVLPYEGDGIRRFVFPQFFDKKVPGVPSHQMKLEVNLDDPSETVVTWFDQLDDGENFIGESLAKILDNPTNKTSSAGYVSGTPTYVLFEHITIPKDIGDAITKFVQGPRTLEEVRPLVRGYDKGTNMWKMMQTGMLPFIGFHGRNFGSGQASNFYLGVQNDPRFKFNLADPTTYLNPIRSFVQPIIDAHKTATGQTVKDAASMPQFAGMNLTDEAATEALRREMYAQGITGEKQGLSAEQLTDTVGTAASQFPGIDKAKSINPFAWQWSKPVPESTFAQRWLMPWMSKGVMSDADVFRPGQLGRDLGSYTEALNRLAPYIAMRRQGFDPKAAAREVNRAQVDYTNLSNFNREYTRRLFPFASYTLGMTPTVFGELASRPGGGMGRTVMATTAAGQSSEQGVTPDYIRETASIPLGMSEDGTRSYITGFGLPFEDPLQFAQLARGNVSGVLRELGSRMNPVPKSLIEIMTGRSLYQAGPFGGREIEDLDPTIGRIVANINDLATGEKTEKAEPFLGNPWAEYIIANAGPGRMLNTARTITDPRKWDTIPWKLALNLGTGVRVADVSPSAQDAILRERLARVMKDFGGRMYSRPYFPDYAKEDWTPQEAEDAAKIDALLKLLGQRAKERRV